MTETISDALERYRELKASFNQDMSEMKDNMTEIKTDIAMLREILGEFKADVRGVLKEFEWINRRSDDMKGITEKLNDQIQNCQFCKSSINVEDLNVKASRALTIATISVTLNVTILGIVAVHMFSMK